MDEATIIEIQRQLSGAIHAVVVVQGNQQVEIPVKRIELHQEAHSTGEVSIVVNGRFVRFEEVG